MVDARQLGPLLLILVSWVPWVSFDAGLSFHSGYTNRAVCVSVYLTQLSCCLYTKSCPILPCLASGIALSLPCATWIECLGSLLMPLPASFLHLSPLWRRRAPKRSCCVLGRGAGQHEVWLRGVSEGHCLAWSGCCPVLITAISASTSGFYVGNWVLLKPGPWLREESCQVLAGEWALQGFWVLCAG